MKLKLRVISGQLKGHLFVAPQAGKTHPMSDRGRMALFNILGDLSQTDLVLDAYGGSGALAFEALSRGAERAVIVEIDRRVYQQLSQNIQALGLKQRIDAYRANNLTCLPNLGLKYDLIFLDPPFDKLKQQSLLSLGQFLKDDGCLVLSHPPHFQSPFQAPQWHCWHSKNYAQLHLKFYELGSSLKNKKSLK